MVIFLIQLLVRVGCVFFLFCLLFFFLFSFFFESSDPGISEGNRKLTSALLMVRHSSFDAACLSQFITKS